METSAAAPAATLTRTFSRFGEVSFAADEIIAFPWGLPGFPELKRFLALSLPEQAPYLWLQAIDDEAVALPVIDPWRIFEDYDPKLPGFALESLQVEAPDDFVVLSVVVAGAGAQDLSVNLLAPVVVNLRKRIARQVTLDDRRYDVRTTVPRGAVAAAVGGNA